MKYVPPRDEEVVFYHNPIYYLENYIKNVPAKNRFIEQESIFTCFVVVTFVQWLFDIGPLSFKVIGCLTLNSEIFHQHVWDFFPHLYHLREINVL